MVHYEKSQMVGTVIIDNPPLNVLGSKLVKELRDVFALIADDPEVNAVILTSAGNKAFMAGADIKEFPQWIGQKDMKDIVMKNHELMNQIDSLPKPTIAVLNGLTLGGGCELALSCDLRIAEEHVQIGLPEIKLGIFPGAGGTQRLPKLIGESKAKELMYTGDSISAREALDLGLVNQVVESGMGLEAARRLANKISRNSLQALSRIKQAVDFGLEASFDAGIDLELELFYQVFQTEDAKEGIQAFIEKRKPFYQNK